MPLTKYRKFRDQVLCPAPRWVGQGGGSYKKAYASTMGDGTKDTFDPTSGDNTANCDTNDDLHCI